MKDAIEHAHAFAEKAHAGQKRKYSGEDYFFHLADVGFRLAAAGMPQDVIVAGILHDVLEDTSVTEDELIAEFGVDITSLVKEVTDVSKPEYGNRAARKQLDLEHLADSSAEGAAIKLADLISNAKDIVKNDPKFARVYLKEKLELLKVLDHGPDVLYKQAMLTLAEGLIDLLEAEKPVRGERYETQIKRPEEAEPDREIDPFDIRFQDQKAPY